MEFCGFCGTEILESDEKAVCEKCGLIYHAECLECGGCVNCLPIELKKEEQQINAEKNRIEAEINRKAVEKRLAEEQTRQKAEQEKYQARLNHLKTLGKDGYYEYKVISIVDKRGSVDIERLTTTLNELGLDGWRLQCAYSNEMGKDSLTIAGFGINSTADQNILIFERFVKFE